MDRKFSIGICGTEDLGQLEEIMKATEAGMEHQDWFVADGKEFLERHLEAEGMILKAVEEQSGEIAGFLIIRFPGMAEDNLGRDLEMDLETLLKVAHMESAAVVNRYRGNGLQGDMMQRAEEIAREKGYVWLMGTVHPDNSFSRNHFLKAGYQPMLRKIKYGGVVREIMVWNVEK